jgi:hypothetical protein
MALREYALPEQQNAKTRRERCEDNAVCDVRVFFFAASFKDVLRFLVFLARFPAQVRHWGFVIGHLFGDSDVVIVSAFVIRHLSALASHNAE